MFSHVFSMGMHGNQASAETQTCRQGLYQLWRHFWRPKDTDGQGIHQETLDKDIQVVPKRWMRWSPCDLLMIEIVLAISWRSICMYHHVSAYAVKENHVIGPWNNIQQKFGIEIHPTALTYAQLVGDSMHSFGSARVSVM
jgi:hypothetical protein